MRYEIVIEESDPSTGKAERVVAETRRRNGALSELARYSDDAYENMKKHAGGDHIVMGQIDASMVGVSSDDATEYFVGHFDSDYNLVRFRRIFIREKLREPEVRSRSFIRRENVMKGRPMEEGIDTKAGIAAANLEMGKRLHEVPSIFIDPETMTSKWTEGDEPDLS